MFCFEEEEARASEANERLDDRGRKKTHSLLPFPPLSLLPPLPPHTQKKAPGEAHALGRRVGPQAQPCLCFLRLLRRRQPILAQQAPRIEGFSALFFQAACRGGRGCGSPGGGPTALRERRARDRPAQVPAAAVSVLLVSNRPLYEPALEQLAVPRLPPQPISQLLRSGFERLAIDRRPAADPPDQRAASRGVRGRGQGVEAVR